MPQLSRRAFAGALPIGLIGGSLLGGTLLPNSPARAATQAVGGDEAPGSLRRLEVAFRGMAVPEEEIAVVGDVQAVDEGLATLSLTARQGKARVVRNGRAVVRVPEGR